MTQTVFYIILVIALSIDFCVLIINLRLIFESYLNTKLNGMLEQRKIEAKELLMLERERWRH